MEKQLLYHNCARASFVRAIDFCYASTTDSNTYSLFRAASLRGIVEDYIVLRSLLDIDASIRVKIIDATLHLEMARAMRRQQDYFLKYRPFQPVLEPGPASHEQLRDRLVLAWKDAGFQTRPHADRPSTRELAKASGLLELYNYLFSLTSNLVHFNPIITFTSGWGDSPNEPVFKFDNFESHYKKICIVYGCELVAEYTRSFSSLLQVDCSIIEAAEALSSHVHKYIRWPEILTFEQLNIKSPSEMMRFLRKACYDIGISPLDRPEGGPAAPTNP